MKLALAILATLLWAGIAQGKTVSIRFNGSCNGLDITISANNPVIKSVENGCPAGFGGGVGVIGNINGYSGKRYVIGENYDDGALHHVGEEFWIISAPLQTGGIFEGWRHKSGGQMKKFGAGTYTVITSP